MPAKLSPRFVMCGEDLKIKRKDLSRNGRRDIPLTLALASCLSLCPSIDGYIVLASQADTCSDMRPR